MNVSYLWLRALAPSISESPDELARRITRVAVPVDDVVSLAAGLDDVVVGRVESVAAHPNADRLVVCSVEIGRKKPVQVVTGAPEVIEGAFYPFIGVGGTLPGGRVIERVKLRGEPSEGMLCSERELGLGRDHTGVMRVDGDLTPGAPFVEALGLDDHRLVLDVTANRPDLLGHLGVAREIAPGGVGDLVAPPFPEHRSAEYATETDAAEAEAAGVTVRVEDADGCPRYMGAVVRGVTVGPSPRWLAARLRSVGVQPINNVVDATNYVLYELNQPVHAFDLSTIRGGAVVVRRARRGERLKTLDGRERKLEPELLVIADAEGATALAGVMGGAASEVGRETEDLFLECAYFDPGRVRTTRRAAGLDTDASYRFERGIDPGGTAVALHRLVELVLTVAGGTAEEAVDVVSQMPRPRSVNFRPGRVRTVLGVGLDAGTVREGLEPIGFEVTEAGAESWSVAVPTWRPDVEREVDLIEEVARRYGYDRFPDEMRPFRPSSTADDEFAELFDRVRGLFVGLGFVEARSLPFTNADEGEVEVVNPLSEREDHLRRDLLSGLAHRTEYNFARGQRDVRLFEIGTVFRSCGGPAPEERVHLGAVWTGARRPAHWTDDAEPDWDLWDVRWVLEQAARVAGLDPDVCPADEHELQSGGTVLRRPFVVMSGDGAVTGRAGRIDEKGLEAPPWAAPVWALEIELRAAAHPEIVYRPLPVYPATERDIALIVPVTVPAAAVEAVIRETDPAHLEALSVFDVYEGAKIEPGTRSVAWRLRFRAPDRTLTDDEVDESMKAVLTALEEELDVRIRGA